MQIFVVSDAREPMNSDDTDYVGILCENSNYYILDSKISSERCSFQLEYHVFPNFTFLLDSTFKVECKLTKNDLQVSFPEKYTLKFNHFDSPTFFCIKQDFESGQERFNFETYDWEFLNFLPKDLMNIVSSFISALDLKNCFQKNTFY